MVIPKIRKVVISSAVVLFSFWFIVWEGRGCAVFCLFVCLLVSYCCCVCLFTFIIVKNPQTISFTHHPDGQEPTECGGRMNLPDFEDQIIF